MWALRLSTTHSKIFCSIALSHLILLLSPCSLLANESSFYRLSGSMMRWMTGRLSCVALHAIKDKLNLYHSVCLHPFFVNLGGAASLWDQGGEAQPLPRAAGAVSPEAATCGVFRRQRAHQEEPGEVQHTRWEDQGDGLQGEKGQITLFAL